MVYIESRKVKGEKYYYLIKSVRLGPKKWKKEKVYLGKHRPSESEIEKFRAQMAVHLKYLTRGQASTLLKIRRGYQAHLSKLSEQDTEKFETATLSHFAYNTSAIEGSSMNLQETGYLLQERRTPAGKDMWEIHSALNTPAAYGYLKRMKEISHDAIKKLHEIVMRNILAEDLGEYRTVFMRIGVARHRPPPPHEVLEQMSKLIDWYYTNKGKMNVFELACIFHIKFEGIHPFRDGNGRVGRMLLNFILIQEGFPLLDIKADRRVEYYQTLDAGNVSRQFKPFIDLVFDIYLNDARSMGWVGI